MRNNNDILVGWTRQEKPKTGFTAQIADTPQYASGSPIYTDGFGHSATVAATGRGKSVMMISRLLRCPQSSIIVDIKGEAYNVTSRYRQEKMGHDIILFDPTHYIKGNVKRANFNPLDVFNIKQNDVEDFVGDIISILFDPANRSSKEPYWDNSSISYANGLLLDLMLRGDAADKNLVTLWERVFNEVYDTAVIADAATEDAKTNPRLKKVIKLLGAILSLPDTTRGGIMSTGQHHFNWLTSDIIGNSLRNTSFDLNAIYNSKPFTMYIVIPPYKVQKLSPLIRLLLHVFSYLLMDRPNAKDNPVRLIVDEAGVIGKLDILENLTSIGRGYSIFVDLLFQDISQLKESYPKSWKTLLGNCRYQQYFGFNSWEDAEVIGRRSGLSPDFLMRMNLDNELMLFIENGVSEIVRKVNYLRDSQHFEGRYDPNPFYL